MCKRLGPVQVMRSKSSLLLLLQYPFGILLTSKNYTHFGSTNSIHNTTGKIPQQAGKVPASSLPNQVTEEEKEN